MSKAKALGSEDPMAARRRSKDAPTFEAFLDQTYAPWAVEHLRSGEKTVEAARAAVVPAFGKLELTEVSAFAVERWRTARMRDNKASASTVNRNLDDLKAMLGKAAAWKLITANPVAPEHRATFEADGWTAAGPRA